MTAWLFKYRKCSIRCSRKSCTLTVRLGGMRKTVRQLTEIRLVPVRQQAEIRLVGCRHRVDTTAGVVSTSGTRLENMAVVSPTHHGSLQSGFLVEMAEDAQVVEKRKPRKRDIEDDIISPPSCQPRKDICVAHRAEAGTLPQAHSDSEQVAAVCEILQEYTAFKPIHPGARFVTERGNTIWRFRSDICPVCLHYREDKVKHDNQWIAVNEDRFKTTTMLQCLLTHKRLILKHKLPID